MFLETIPVSICSFVDTLVQEEHTASCGPAQPLLGGLRRRSESWLVLLDGGSRKGVAGAELCLAKERTQLSPELDHNI